MQLKAINTMLSAIGEAPVSSLNSGLPEAEMAESILNEISEAVQSEGWTFNTEIDFPLSADPISSNIALPDNYLEVDLSENVSQGPSRYVVRGNRVYDREAHTYTITAELKADIILLLDFSELPQTARTYITIRAARIFQDRVLGSDTIHRFNADDEQYARVALKRMAVRKSGINLINNGVVQSIVSRRI
ncbi:hypothetical protein [Bacterioplanoides sp.]|uniref:hypothetical protein n=1 Tax=Bacterioplanoides sp. TaxID=2066072 RepID=UPI003B00EE5A